MRKVRLVIPLFLVLLLVACAYFQDIQKKWNELTPDEQARVIINGLQDQLDVAFDQAKLQIGNKPEWKTKVVPAFDVANKTLGDVIAIGKTGSITPELVYSKIGNLVVNALALAKQYGWIKK